MTIGSCSSVMFNQKFPRVGFFRKIQTIETHYRTVRILYLANYLLVLPINSFLAIKALSIFGSGSISVAVYRSVVFSEDILFPNPQIKLLYDILISPVSFVSFFIGVAIYALIGESHLMILSSLILSLVSLAFGGRFNFYMIVFTLGFVFFLKRKSLTASVFSVLKKVKKYKIPATVLLMSVMVAMMIIFSILRSPKLNVIDLADKFVYEYHTLGFTLFDQELNRQQSLLNQHTTNRMSSLGTIERSAVLLFRRFDRNIDSSSVEIGRSLSKFRVVGYVNGKPILSNAFGTVLYSLYMDGGLILVLIVTFTYGFYLQKFSWLVRINSSIYNLSVLLTLIYIGIFGIFMPLLAGSYWLYLIYVRVLLRKSE